ncbi:MAG: hypothetical protein ACK4ON_09240 [Bacteroidia bacterium]
MELLYHSFPLLTLNKIGKTSNLPITGGDITISGSDVGFENVPAINAAGNIVIDRTGSTELNLVLTISMDDVSAMIRSNNIII